MELHLLKPKKSLNKAFLKVKPNRTEIEGFKSHLIQLLDHINDDESEEFHKNLVIDFLKKTYYDPNHFVNTKGRNDLVIHNGDKATTPVGVIVEAKKPTNRAEMVTKERLNVKAFQELVLYYLRERISQKNIEVKHLIITNINEWFIFDAIVFDRLFAQNKGFVKQFKDFENKRLADISTDFFYKQVAEPFIAEIKQSIEFTYFDIRNYENPLRNDNQKDDNQLIALFKLLSPEHLLKLPFVNDSNSLDKRFYGELLHIIGLEETKEGSKKIIGRKKKGERNSGSFLENAIIQLDSLDKISRLDNPTQFGETLKERLFNVGLELSITWINRILFLKLLEAQLITYHKGDKSYEFLNFEKISDYDALNKLFFQVLAREHSERTEQVQKAFEKVPYLNSSLFEPNEMEHKMLFISNLEDGYALPIYSASVLKDEKGKRRTGKMNPLEYLFEFLNSYDFTSEGGENIQEENKTLINASVLGLIFEKINGYKDGSFFTPGFITMYMCRETIRKAVVQKFNETKNWNCTDMVSLYNKIEDRDEANEIINDLKICDPAVGSGHFLVSALNEMLAIKNDLRILQDREGQRLKEYHFEVVNDELIVTDEEGELFEYNPTNRESQRVQETLFHEKQTIIENCLFGVDINPNSVKICRLRLWIELLKNAYYKTNSPPSQGGVPEGGGGSFLPSQGGAPAGHTSSFNSPPSQGGVPEGGGGSFLPSQEGAPAGHTSSFNSPPSQGGVPEGGGGSFPSQAVLSTGRGSSISFVPTGGGGSLRQTPFQRGDRWELETLPNIDINIKCGNSLVSRFALDADLKQALRTSKWTIDSYRVAVQTYRNAHDKEQKREMERLIADIKTDFRSEISLNDPKVKRLAKLKGELFTLTQQTSLFDMSAKEKAAWDNKAAKLTIGIKKLEAEIEEIKSNKIYENAFEWRFEFPEVLNDDGEFLGFDVVVGNPPYLQLSKTENITQEYKNYLLEMYQTSGGRLNTFIFFLHLSNKILNFSGFLHYIVPNTILSQEYYSFTRDFLVNKVSLTEIANFPILPFEDAVIETVLIQYSNKVNLLNNIEIKELSKENIKLISHLKKETINRDSKYSFVYQLNPIIEKVYEKDHLTFGSICNINQGIALKGDKSLSLKDSKKNDKCFKLLDGRNIHKFSISWDGVWLDYDINKIHSCKRKDIFESKEKLMFRRVSSSLIFTYDNQQFFALNTLVIVNKKDIKKGPDIKFILGLMNSKLMNYVYTNKFKSTKTVFSEIQARSVKELPIVISTNDQENKIKVLTEEIINLKKNDLDTTDLEAQIDQLVYALYDLTPEEIEIIESEVK